MSLRVGSIYKIQNIVNQKVYIGQTLDRPETRWHRHLSEINNYMNFYPLYADMRNFGIINFSFQVVETNIPIDLLDAKEIYYISHYKSFYLDGGYNLTRGGQCSKSSKLTELQVLSIINRIRNGEDFKQLSLEFNVSYSTISDINCGDTWHFEIFDYPIRKQSNPKRNYSLEEAYEIRQQLKAGCNLTSVAKLHNTSVQTIRRINLGELYKDDNETYPLYDTKQGHDGHLSDYYLLLIIEYLLSTSLNYNQISRELKDKYNISIDRHTISGINNGSCYSSRLAEFGYEYFPIR